MSSCSTVCELELELPGSVHSDSAGDVTRHTSHHKSSANQLAFTNLSTLPPTTSPPPPSHPAHSPVSSFQAHHDDDEHHKKKRVVDWYTPPSHPMLLSDTWLMDSFPRPLPPAAHQAIKGKNTNELDLTQYIWDTTSDPAHGPTPLVPSAVMFNQYDGPMEHYMIRSGRFHLLYSFLWNLVRIYLFIYNCQHFDGGWQVALQMYIKWLNCWPYIEFFVILLGLRAMSQAQHLSDEYKHKYAIHNTNEISQYLQVDQHQKKDLPFIVAIRINKEIESTPVIHPIRYQYCTIETFLFHHPHSPSTNSSPHSNSNSPSRAHHIVNIPSSEQVTPPPTQLSSLPYRVHPKISIYTSSSSLSEFSLEDELPKLIAFERPNFFVRLVRRVLVWCSKRWPSPIWMTAPQYSSLTGWYIDPRNFFILFVGGLVCIIGALVSELSWLVFKPEGNYNPIEMYISGFDAFGWMTGVLWIILLSDRMMRIMNDIVSHLHLCREITHARDAYEHVFRAFKQIRRNTQLFINMSGLTMFVLSLHSLLGTIGNSFDTLPRFIAFALISLYFLVFLVQVNNKMENFKSAVLRYQVLSDAPHKVMGFVEYLRVNPVVYKLFGVPITSSVITGYAVAASVAVLGALAPTIYIWCQSGYF